MGGVATVRFEGGAWGLVFGGVFLCSGMPLPFIALFNPAPFLNCVLCGFSLATEVFAVVVAVFSFFLLFSSSLSACA